MRKLIIALAISAVLASAPMAMAGGAGFQNWMEKWRMQTAEQQQIDRSLDKIDRDAARWGTPAEAGAMTLPQQPASPTSKARPEY